jgi:transcriptional regulator with XRE-family HTH domain
MDENQMEAIRQRWAEALSKYIDIYNISLKQLSERMGESYSHVSQVRSGSKPLTLSMLINTYLELGIDIHKILEAGGKKGAKPVTKK